ncbi:MAG: trypsin-like serine peptidase [Agrococcus casei]|uniref:trypsin-like serine peptidase n=1 Tax=Agrococcus casei TaxID=343512 RepID=UPI003F8F8632
MTTRRIARLLLAATAAAAMTLTATGCVVVPAVIDQLQPVPIQTDPPPQPNPPGPDGEPDGQDDPTQGPNPDGGEQVPAPDPDELGLYLDGATDTSGSQLLHDDPVDVVVPPSAGTPDNWTTGPNLYAEESAGSAFMPNTEPGSAFHLMQSSVGRMYATMANGSRSACSGTVVNSDNGSVIATAAHCVWDFDANAPLREILFVPGDRGNAQTSPWGIWAVDRVWVPDEFTDTAMVDSDGRTMGEGWAYDYAFATIAPNSSGEVIQSYTGGQGISFAQQYAGIVTVGYPSDPPYDGQSPRYCATASPGFGTMYWPHTTIRCDMTGGSSGSGWLTGASFQSGAGYLTAVTSTGNSYSEAEPPWMLSGALFGATAHELFQAAEAA